MSTHTENSPWSRQIATGQLQEEVETPKAFRPLLDGCVASLSPHTLNIAKSIQR
jgi:hypothetical protein